VRVNLTGRTFARLKVLCISHFKGEGKKRAVFWWCRCKCGTELPVRMNNLTSGHAKSCGCLKREKAALQGKSCRTHGMARLRKVTPEYHAYQHAKDRCENPKNAGYRNYGGRGIKFLFTSFAEFFAELGPRPRGKSLDRIKNNGNYELGNVRWATWSQQNKNRRPFAKKSLL
jgi:hypothetical protein